MFEKMLEALLDWTPEILPMLHVHLYNLWKVLYIILFAFAHQPLP